MKAFFDPDTRLLKAWGYVLTNDAGDIAIDVPDTFASARGAARLAEDDETIEPYTPDPPATIVTVVNFGIARFTVAAGVVSTTPDSSGIASVLRVSAGRYRVYYIDADPDRKLIARPPAIMDANIRSARISAKTAAYTEIRVVDGASPPAAADASEVTLWIDKVVSQ